MHLGDSYENLKKTSGAEDSHLHPNAGACGHTIQAPPNLPNAPASQQSCCAETEKFVFVAIVFLHQPFHSIIDFSLFLLHILSHPILHLPHCLARFLSLLSHRQALCSAEQPSDFIGLIALSSRCYV